MPEPSAPTAVRRAPRPIGPPDPALVRRLQRVVADPAVSVLMSTRPAATMTGADRSRLRALVRGAGDRLGREHPLLPALAALAEEVSASATGEAVALFVSAQSATWLALPVPVTDRVVVDPTFATRDLVRAMHRTPRHAVLVLSESAAQLYDAVSGVLVPAAPGRFPLTRQRDTLRGRHPGRPRLHEAEVTAFLRIVDRALGAHLSVRPAPLVLVGPPRLIQQFRRVSGHLSRVAGTVTGNLAGLPPAELAARVHPVVLAYLRSRESEALALLDRRTGEGRAVSGVAAVWLAARRERPEMLVVDEGLAMAVRLADGGDLVVPADDVDHPDVIDDLVDEVIEVVLNRGGWVALVADGGLAAHDGIALTIRDRF